MTAKPRKKRTSKKKTATKVDTAPKVQTPITEPPPITIQDIQTMLAVINTSTERGAFKGNELQPVGALYEKLVQFVEWAAGQSGVQTDENTPDEETKD